MTCRTLSSLILLLALVLSGGASALAETDLNQLDPNVYEEKERKENTEYLHEKGLYEKRKEIPEEQKSLTFQKPGRDAADELKDRLFTQYTKENNTIKSKAEQMGLFSENTDQASGTISTEEEQQQSGNTGLLMTYILLIAVGVLLIIGILIPKMTQSKKADAIEGSR
ncbi:type VII secretion protein EssA [Metabacillus indicus]|uniref:type VII secretion protein EssA n=1 Tax=Metabacillus indicus TaxID=246786 RepID=UPI003171076B